MREKRSFMVVVGASAGGMGAICELIGQLKREVNATIVIVQHLPQKGEATHLRSRLQKCTSLPCQVAGNRMSITRGHIYLAPAGAHLLVGKKQFQLGKGPAEGWWRPSIDATFRSAAVGWDSHCIGIVLTGMLDDGTAGMDAIRQCGGWTIVQDPTEAEYPNMPLSVLRILTPNECIRLAVMGKSIRARLRKNPAAGSIPDEVLKEALMSERANTDVDAMQSFPRSGFACPDCGGSLWEVGDSRLKRYRCHLGHAYTEKELLATQDRETEKTLWVALRTLEEKRNLLEKIALREEEQLLHTLSKDHTDRAGELKGHITRLKEMIYMLQNGATD